MHILDTYLSLKKNEIKMIRTTEVTSIPPGV